MNIWLNSIEKEKEDFPHSIYKLQQIQKTQIKVPYSIILSSCQIRHTKLICNITENLDQVEILVFYSWIDRSGVATDGKLSLTRWLNVDEPILLFSIVYYSNRVDLATSQEIHRL